MPFLTRQPIFMFSKLFVFETFLKPIDIYVVKSRKYMLRFTFTFFTIVVQSLALLAQILVFYLFFIYLLALS
jgi:hypothetical protein